MADVIADQTKNATSLQSDNRKLTPIVFQGKASEYFGIWIVNLLLSLLTLGIYSAWAKVRRKKYFYNNTLIDNVGFDYHANPIAILKGRVIAFVFFIGYSQSVHISPFLPILFLVIFFIALPWIVVRGLLFNARNSSHRGLRFDFVGKVGQAVKVFIGLPLLLIPTFGLIAPYVAHERSQFVMSNHRFGLSQFDMSRVVKQFYKVYLIVFIVPFIGILAAIAIPAYQAYVNKAKAAAAAPHAALSMPNVQAFAPINQQMVLAANDATTQMPADAAKVERVYSENAPAETPTAADSNPLQAKAAERVEQAEQAAEIGDANAGTALPAETATTDDAADEPPTMTADELKVQAEQDKALEEMLKKQSEEAKIKEWISSPLGIIAALGGLLLYGFVIFGFLSYFQSRIHNLVWNNTTLDKLSFKSSLRARDFMWLYFTNLLAIIFTFGLASPWAHIRMARYRTSKLHIIGDVDFDQFVGDKKANIKATGEEIADFFDVDLSFG